jgi:L-ascorbate metabolism protein UlaG (beta-lactamase superfamily)
MKRLRIIGANMSLKITLINHATILIEMDGAVVLTDPIYSRTVAWTIPRRKKPGMLFEILPPIDAILVSHSDYDHLNLKTLRMLRRKGSSLFVAPSGLGRYGRRAGFAEVAELAPWESIGKSGITITGTPAKHHSKRTAWDRTDSSCCGFVIRSAHHTVYFAGDTGYADFFSEIATRYSIDVALLPIGAYKPEKWFKNLHLDPATAVRAFLDLKARHFVPYHWGTFWLSDEPMDEPPRLLMEEARKFRLEESIHVLENGEFIQV